MHKQVKEHLKKVDRAMKHRLQNTTSSEERCVFCERSLVSDTSKVYDAKYSKTHRYKLTLTSPKGRAKEAVTHDFSTPEGREVAFKWFDK
jgi:hypothetical protein